MAFQSALVPPVERVAALYGPGQSFAEELEAMLEIGVVISNPAAFAMGKIVPRWAPWTELADPWAEWPPAECDAWLIWAVAGDMRVLTGWLGRLDRMRWVGWSRRGKAIRWRLMADVVRRLEGRIVSPGEPRPANKL